MVPFNTSLILYVLNILPVDSPRVSPLSRGATLIHYFQWHIGYNPLIFNRGISHVKNLQTA